MCNAAGVSRSALSDYKTGKNKTIFIDNLREIADYLEISLNCLLGNTDIKEKPVLTKKDEPDITFDDFITLCTMKQKSLLKKTSKNY